MPANLQTFFLLRGDEPAAGGDQPFSRRTTCRQVTIGLFSPRGFRAGRRADPLYAGDSRLKIAARARLYSEFYVILRIFRNKYSTDALSSQLIFKSFRPLQNNGHADLLLSLPQNNGHADLLLSTLQNNGQADQLLALPVRGSEGMEKGGLARRPPLGLLGMIPKSE